ncbi:MAG: alpha/beta fold hydrolase [Acidobacteriia bacterium]|nr:alpha/beta fold hydrolase [Terriglobia bacterium]
MKSCGLALLLLLAVLPVAARQSGGESSVVGAGKQVVQQIAAGQFDKVEAQYNAQMSAALPAGKLAASWADVLDHAGSFESITEARTGRVRIYDVVVVVCKFQQAVLDAEVAFGPDGKIAGLGFRPHQEPPPAWTAPAYAKPESFTEQPLALVNGKFQLPGTLTLPKGAGPFPAVVLLHGSGPHDQDETIGPNAPLKDLAWGLASRGIAVFRYTKRTQKYGAQSNDDPARLTVDDETMNDARAAVGLLVKDKKIDPRRIFVVGHSLGAYLAPWIAAREPRITGIVMLAANTRPIEQLMVEQLRYALSAGGTPTAADQKQLAALEESARKIESPDLKPGDTVAVLGGVMPATYWLDLRGYRPVALAGELKIPILILQGGRDFQVPPATNFAEWQAALAGHKNVTLKLYPDLNHLFITGEGPSLPQEYQQAGHIDEPVVTDIAAWISAGGKLPD